MSKKDKLETASLISYRHMTKLTAWLLLFSVLPVLTHHDFTENFPFMASLCNDYLNLAELNQISHPSFSQFGWNNFKSDLVEN